MRSLTRPQQRVVVAGDLTEFVTIEDEVRVADGYHGHTRQWRTVGEAYAFVEPLSTSEREVSGALRNVTSYRFTVYRREDVGEGMRIVWGDRAYLVTGVPIGGARALFMEIIAEHGTGD